MTAFRHPADAWKVVLLLAGWSVFARSLAEKAVTLVTATTASGEPQRPDQARSWAAMLGTFSFASGVIAGNWHLACLGVVFSTLTAAAMWQNFRARLPYLFDPWSERLPPPPTLMHAMVAVTGMLELMSVLTLLFAAGLGRERLTALWVVAYGVAGFVVWIATDVFLSSRGLPRERVWRWQAGDVGPEDREATPPDAGPPATRLVPAVATALAGAVTLGVAAVAYRLALFHLPGVGQALREQVRQLAAHPGDGPWIAFAAIGLAPLAEEYLFRGLLFRALDREWGGWRALVGSAAFFAVYHPPLSWLPVAALGLFTAWLFRRTGRLAACVLAHAAYNAIVTFFTLRG